MKKPEGISKNSTGKNLYIWLGMAVVLLVALCAGFSLYFGQAGKAGEEECVQEQTIKAEGILKAVDAVKLIPDSEDIQLFEPDWIWEDGISSRSKENFVAYADGYYYYRSQLDNYYLYRAREDGTEQTRLAAVQPGSIYVDKDTVYFINLSDGETLYKVNTDGGGLCRVSELSFRYLAAWKDYFYFLSDDENDKGLWRIKKNGSEQELIVKGNILDFAADGEKLVYTIKNEVTSGYKMYFCDMNGEGKTEMTSSLSECPQNMQIYRQAVYFNPDYTGKQLYIMKLEECDKRLEITLPGRRWKVANGAVYCLSEEVKDSFRRITLYGTEINQFIDLLEGRESLDSKDIMWKSLYEYETPCSNNEYWGTMAFFNITESRLFICQFQSMEQGLAWVALDQQMQSCMWEDSQNIPVVLPAAYLQYGEGASAVFALSNSEDDSNCKQYIEKELTYEESREVYSELTDGTEVSGECEFSICLPQFSSEIEGYRKINQYFKERYDRAIKEKEDFFTEAQDSFDGQGYFMNMDYGYIYLNENYLMVSCEIFGYLGGIRFYLDFEPVLFDRNSGKQLAFGDLFTVSEEEALQRLLASIYKYMECTENARLTLADNNILLSEYDPSQFYLSKEGIGIYYPRYAIDAGAAGDFLFIVPYETVADILVKPYE